MTTQTRDYVTIDAMPLMADIYSGAVPEPAPWRPRQIEMQGPAGPYMLPDPPYWQWAKATLAVQAVIRWLGLDDDPETGDPVRRWQPWRDPGDTDLLAMPEETQTLLELIGEGGGIIYTEMSWTRSTGIYNHYRGYLIAVNQDGTRAIYVQVLPDRRADEQLTLWEAAQLLRLSAATLRVQIRNGVFNAQKLGRDWFTTYAEVERYRREHRRKQDA